MKICNSSSSTNKTHSNNAQKVGGSESLNIKKDTIIKAKSNGKKIAYKEVIDGK